MTAPNPVGALTTATVKCTIVSTKLSVDFTQGPALNKEPNVVQFLRMYGFARIIFIQWTLA